MGAMKRDRQAALRRFEAAVELPLVILAIVMVPLLVVPLLVDLPDEIEVGFIAADWLIWAAFAFEYLVRLALTEDRLRFVRREWPSLLLVVLPFLRPLRVVRSARALRLLGLGRLAGALGTVVKDGRQLLFRHNLHYAVLITVVVVVGSAAAAWALEEDGGGAIDSLGDALWWAVTTVTTVGYGDMFPVTPAGRGVAAFLMLSGIALFGVLTANIAAFFVEQDQDDDPLMAKVDEVLRRLDQLDERLARVESRTDADSG
jgi:voltage-gated potassium channel